MTNKLQQYFPMIRTREEVLNEIESKSRLKNLFYEWTEENQNEFLDFCTGVKGIKIMYDFMIKEILNPENTPERVNELLTLLLGQRVRIVDVLPNDGTRLADESTLLITDMVVQLEDGSIANLEIQKIGYYFPGERSACYSADLLLRQYKRVRGIKGKRFSYRDIKQVYTIVLFEKSPTEFQKFSTIHTDHKIKCYSKDRKCQDQDDPRCLHRGSLISSIYFQNQYDGKYSGQIVYEYRVFIQSLKYPNQEHYFQ